MPGNVRVGRIETDAVPGAILTDTGFQEIETAPDAFPACISKRPWRRRRISGRQRHPAPEGGQAAPDHEVSCAGTRVIVSRFSPPPVQPR